ncbi:MAG: hypothetical protein HOW73_24185 [Polyangiaceae bacterium]|nr:hypothetical protein [Polyangiaceae bacterium]
MYEVTEVVENDTDSELLLIIEPWGDELVIGPRQRFTVRFRAPTRGASETHRAPGAVTVFAWSGATAEVLDGDRLVRDYPTAVPPLPPAMSVRQFLHLFGLNEKK